VTSTTTERVELLCGAEDIKASKFSEAEGDADEVKTRRCHQYLDFVEN
jgi:hypothetical protein